MEAIQRVGFGTDRVVQNQLGKTGLIEAALREHEDVLRTLLYHGADVQQTNTCGNTALHCASFLGRSGIVKQLLNAGANVNARTKNEVTPLHMAASHGHEEIVRLLVKNGAEIEAKTSINVNETLPPANEVSEITPETIQLNICSKGTTPLYEAVLHGHEAVIKCLLQLGADVTITDANAENLLFAAARSAVHNHLGGDKLPLATTKQSAIANSLVLLGYGVEVNATSNLKHSALHIAARDGLLELVQQFVKMGMNVNIRTLNGDSAFHYAAKYGRSEVVKWLVSQGFDPHVKNRRGCTPLHLAASYGDTETMRTLLEDGAGLDIEECDSKGLSPLMRSVWSKKIENVRFLLDRGADIDREAAVYTGINVAYSAVQNEEIEILKLLVDRGAKLDILSHIGTLLHVAAQNGRTKVLPMLIKSGLSQTATTQQGKTALHLAAWCGKPEAVNCLLDHGSQIEAIDDLGQTPLQLAVSKGELETVSLLCQRGANINRTWDDGPKILDIALQHKHVNVARFLISKGADKLGRPRTLQIIETALSEANCPTLQFLIENDDDSIFTSSACPTTLFHAAVYGKNDDFATFLVRKGFNINDEDEYGLSALRAAVKTQNLSMVDLLLKNGIRKDMTPLNGSLVQMALDLANESIAICLIRHGVAFDHQNVLLYATNKGLEDFVRVLVCEFKIECPEMNLDEALLGVIQKDRERICNLLLDNGANADSRSVTGETALHLACVSDNIKSVTLLLARGADIEGRDKRWRTPLMISESLRMTELLLKQGANLKATDNDDWTALHHAIAAMTAENLEADEKSSNSANVMDFLIAQGADLNAKDDAGYTPLHIACSGHSVYATEQLLANRAQVDPRSALDNQPLHLALQVCDVGNEKEDGVLRSRPFKETLVLEILNLLVRYGADINEPGQHAKTALHHTVDCEDSAGVCRWLMDKGGDIEALDDDGNTPLLRACLQHDPGSCIPLFLEYGIESHVVDPRYRHALDNALAFNDWPAANRLLGCGVDTDRSPDRDVAISIWTCMHNSYFHLLRFLLSLGSEDIEEKTPYGFTPLAIAVRHQDLESIRILLEYGADPEASEPCTCGTSGHSENPFHIAARFGNADVLRILLDTGLDPNKGNHHSSTGVTLTAQYGHVKCLQMLLDIPNIDINAVDHDGDSALICSVIGYKPETARMLLARADVDTSIRNHQGFTAEELAQSRSQALRDCFTMYNNGSL